MVKNNRCFVGVLFILLFSFLSIEKPHCGEIKNQDRLFWAPKNPPTAAYRFVCEIDPDTRSLKGSGMIRFNNTTKRPIYRLAIDWAVNEHQTIEIRSQGKLIHFLDSPKGQAQSPLVFELPERLNPENELMLMLNFSMNDSLPINPGLSIATDSTVDYLTMRTFLPGLWWGFSTCDDYEVMIKVPSDYIIATSGRLNSKTGYYSGQSIRHFGLFIGKNYEVMDAEVGETLISCYYNEKSKYPAQIILNTAVRAIGFFRDYFGFYPYKQLNFVPGSKRWWGGWNTATSLASMHSMERYSPDQDNHWRTMTVHEIAHMYWGEYVMEKDTPDWLWLGLGIYTQREYDRMLHAEPNSPHGYLSRYEDAIKQYLDTTVEVPPHHLHKMEYFFNSVVSHGKGYSIISTLYSVLGHDTFDRIIRRCLEEFGGHRLGASEFQLICEQESQDDLGWFFEPWLRSNRYPSYRIGSRKCVKKGDFYESRITVDRTGTLNIPVPVAVLFEDGTSQIQFTDRTLEKNTLIFRSVSPLDSAVIDPDHLVALVVPPPKGDFDSQVEVCATINGLPWTGVAEKGLVVYNDAKKTGIHSARMWYKLGLILYDARYYSQAINAFNYALTNSDKDSYIPFAAHTWKGHIFDLSDKRESALASYHKALKVYPGYAITLSQYNMEIDKKWVEQRLTIPFQR